MTSSHTYNSIYTIFCWNCALLLITNFVLRYLFQKFIATLDDNMVKQLGIRSLRRGIGSMDYNDTLLIIENDLDEDDQDAERLGEFGESSHDSPLNSGTDPSQSQTPSQSQNPNPTLEPTLESVPDWCTCGKCMQTNATTGRK